MAGSGVVAVLCAVLHACSEEPGEEAQHTVAPLRAGSPHHILLISVDTLRPDRLGCYGGPRPISPTIDALARDGVRFEQAMAPIPQTTPSHASLFTGQYPLTHGLTTNNNAMRLEPITLAEILRDHGYATGAFFHIFPLHQARVDQGFETSFLDRSPRAEQLGDEVARFLGDHPDEPVFAFVHYYLPHSPLGPPDDLSYLVETPYEGPLDHSFRTLHGLHKGTLRAPREFLDNYRDQYDAEIADTDRKLEGILAGFRERGLLEQTLVIFTADHGERLEDGIVGLHAPFLLETTLQVPLVLTGPGIPKGKSVPDVVELIDVFATIVEAVDIPLPGPVASRSLLPLARGEPVDWDGTAYAMLPSEYMGRVEPGGSSAPRPAALAIRDERFLLVRDSTGQQRLRDLERPYETRDLPLAEHAETLQRLDTALTRWMNEVPTGLAGGALDADTRRLLKELGYEVD